MPLKEGVGGGATEGNDGGGGETYWYCSRGLPAAENASAKQAAKQAAKPLLYKRGA